MNKSQLEIVKKLIEKLDYLVDATITDAGESYDEESDSKVNSWDIKTHKLVDSYYKDIREAGDVLTEAKKVFNIE